MGVQTRFGRFCDSVTNEICPEELSPWHSPAFQYFGAKWTGPGAPARGPAWSHRHLPGPR